MLIHTPVRQLHVLRILQKTADAVSYVCTDVLENVPQYYLLNGFLQQETYSYLIPMIIEQQKEYFTDFIEYFSSDGIFYLMFSAKTYRKFPILIINLYFKICTCYIAFFNNRLFAVGKIKSIISFHCNVGDNF